MIFEGDIPKSNMFDDYTDITDEIEKLKRKLLQLETVKEKAEMEKKKKQSTFEYYLNQLAEFIQMKKDREIKNNPRTAHIRQQNVELVPALEYIYSSLDIIHKKITVLEDKINK